MSNRNERQRLKAHKRLVKLFGTRCRITWNNRTAEIWGSVIVPNNAVYVRAYGSAWEIRCPKQSFTWAGQPLQDGINQLKVLQLIRPIP